MTKANNDYRLLIDRISSVLAQTPNELARWVEISESYIQAASNMTKDEIALIEAYFNRDVHTFSEQYQNAHNDDAAKDAFRAVIANSCWEKLADITDKTQLEWQDVFRDIEHHGVYRAGEIVGLGRLTCEQCGHETEHYHVELLASCVHCGGHFFNRG